MLKMADEKTPVTQINMLGMDFHTASFMAFDIEQTVYAIIINGEQVSIQLGGQGHAIDTVMQAMPSSIELKQP